ncbi:MAG: DUF4190 domain-containing protein [Bacteroidota bacterium]
MKKTQGMAVAGFVCSLAGLLLFGFILGILAIIFSANGMGKINREPELYKGKGLATAGLIIGIFDILAWGIYLIVAFN